MAWTTSHIGDRDAVIAMQNHLFRALVFNLFAGAEPQRNIPVVRGTPVQ